MPEDVPDQVFTLRFWFEPSQERAEWRGAVIVGTSSKEPVASPDEAFALVRKRLMNARLEKSDQWTAERRRRTWMPHRQLCQRLDHLAWRLAMWRSR